MWLGLGDVVFVQFYSFKVELRLFTAQYLYVFK
jgi:hypothetical protein